MFLVNPQGDVVYTVFKETDFSTNLFKGPYRDTGLARAVRAAFDSAGSDEARLADFELYDPSYGAPAAFIATPIRSDGKMIGVLALQLPVDEINRVMTGNMNWPADGLGESGETYLVGPDFKMRSVSRFLSQEPERYFELLASIGVSRNLIERIRATKTSILLQDVRTEAAEKAQAGQAATSIINDYRGVPVLSSYVPLSIPGLQWVLLSEIDVDEAFAPVERLARLILISASIILIAIAILSLRFATTFTRPIHTLARAARAISAGDYSVAVKLPNQDEFGQLGQTFNLMVGDIRSQREIILQKSEESERLLLNILPVPIAARLKQGEDRIADAFADVSVLFADLVGFTRMSAEFGAEKMVQLLNELFSNFDTIARKHGVEKIKTIGDCYMVVAGLPHPRSDHAEVTAELAIDMLELIDRMNVESGTTLSIRIGMNCGSVVAGVIGSNKFIYDLWGDTVNIASRMESQGAPGTIHVTHDMAERLSASYVFEERGIIDVKGRGPMRTYFMRGRVNP